MSASLPLRRALVVAEFLPPESWIRKGWQPTAKCRFTTAKTRLGVRVLLTDSPKEKVSMRHTLTRHVVGAQPTTHRQFRRTPMALALLLMMGAPLAAMAADYPCLNPDGTPILPAPGTDQGYEHGLENATCRNTASAYGLRNSSSAGLSNAFGAYNNAMASHSNAFGTGNNAAGDFSS